MFIAADVDIAQFKTFPTGTATNSYKARHAPQSKLAVPFIRETEQVAYFKHMMNMPVIN